MRTVSLLAIAVLVVTAGCSAPPAAEPTTDLSVSLSNEHDEPYRVTVAVVPDGFEAVEVTYANGTTRRVDATSLDSIPRSALDGAVGFAPVGPGVESRVYDLEPGTGVGDTFPTVPRNATVVDVVGRPTATDPTETLRSFGAANCGGSATVEFSLRIDPDGSLSSSNACR